MIPQDLLDVLVCPQCRKSLILADDALTLKCAQCRRVYPVRDGIPVLLLEEAVIEAPGA